MKILTLFRKLFIVTRLKVRGNNQSFTYVAIGDSTVEGIGASSPDKTFPSLIYAFLKQNFKQAKFHNLGVSGARVEDVLRDQLPNAIALNPQLIVVSIGANDVVKRTKLSTFEKNYQLLLKSLVKNTRALIVVNDLPDISIAPAVPRVTIPYIKMQTKRFNQKILQFCKQFGCIGVDLYYQSKVYRGYKEFISADGFHPSDSGYALWANTIIASLMPLMGKITAAE